MSCESSFKGKSVIVTGAGRGIGRGIAVKLHELGANVYAVSKNPDNLTTLKTECPNTHPVAVDLSNWEATREAVEKLPVVDYLVNNAGILIGGNFLDVLPQDFDAVCNVNLKAVINISQVVAKKIIAAEKPGSIVNVSSVAGLKAIPEVCTYSTLKAGLDHLTKIMAIELAPFKIRVNSVNPGAVLTDMLASTLKQITPQSDGTSMLDGLNARIPATQKIIEIDEIVATTLYLLSDAAPMITGSSVALDGGYCIG
ncbi:unnamed protein product [Allacma fusca]|uniref:Uncharacterized protein n=1 Tax=Allacma fusca TaxID=39272 RepID=A0A8J2MF81_9HEXA|nr:unnamed protein product [Allacma fusca]